MVQGGIALAMMLAAGDAAFLTGLCLGPSGSDARLWRAAAYAAGGLGAINAYNMVDGIDGQLGALSCVTFVALAILFGLGGREDLALWCLGLIVALAAYLLFNLSLFGARNKIFMGDAGSMVIGFSVLWLVLLATQGPQAVMRPVTALWLIAIPLMDMVTVMVRRLLRRQSPFKAGRDHLHHIFDAPRAQCAPGAGNEHHAGGDAGLRRHLQRSVEAAGKPDAGGVSALFLRLFRHAA